MHEYPAIVGVSHRGRVMYECNGKGVSGEHVHALPASDILPDEVGVLWTHLTERQRMEIVNLEEIRAESPEPILIAGMVQFVST